MALLGGTWPAAAQVGTTAARIPAGGFPVVGPAWAGALRTNLSSPLLAADTAELKGSVLPSLTRMDLSNETQFPQVAPLVHYLSAELGYGPQSFAALSPEERRDVLLMAADEAASAIAWDASLAMSAAQEALGANGSFENLESADGELGRFDRQYAMYLNTHQLSDLRKLHDKTSSRVRELRRSRALGQGAEIAGRLAADDIGVAVTKRFADDTAAWGGQQWKRLETELAKVRTLYAGDTQLRGEIGNIKFLAGPLSGLGEIKFGTNRTHRVFFRYHAKTKRVVFLRVLARETMNKNAGHIEELQAFREDAKLTAEMKEPSPEIPLLKKVTPADLDIRLSP